MKGVGYGFFYHEFSSIGKNATVSDVSIDWRRSFVGNSYSSQDFPEEIVFYQFNSREKFIFLPKNGKGRIVNSFLQIDTVTEASTYFLEEI